MQRLRESGGGEAQVRSAPAALRGCRQASREITRTINLWTLLARDEGEKAAKRERFPRAFSVDTPGETVAVLRAYEEAGAQYAIVKLLDADEPEPVRLFAAEVMPAFGG